MKEIQPRPLIGPRFSSLFGYFRPPIRWDTADKISEQLGLVNARSVGVTGSLSPSVLTACGYGDSNREVNAYARYSGWDEVVGYSHVREDSDGEDTEWPAASHYLPVANVHFWDGASPFFWSDCLFIDLPFNHPAVGLKLDWLKKRKHKLVMLGFFEGHDGPNDVREWLEHQDYFIQENTEVFDLSESGAKNSYKLAFGIARSRKNAKSAPP